MTIYLSLYTLTSLSNIVFISESAGINMQEGLCLKNDKVWRKKATKYNANWALARV